jgi:hypothetical protein
VKDGRKDESEVKEVKEGRIFIISTPLPLALWKLKTAASRRWCAPSVVHA